MMRVTFILCLMGGMALAETEDKAPPPEPETTATECDTCQARQNGKRALRDYLAQKRADEEAEAKDDD
ncbi:MAG: hypothetical protein AAGL23_08475 [Pseudomonadota bacterium]